MTFEPAGDHSESSLEKLHLLHGTLPHEVVCTENLTPFLKLLPCKGKAGISSLLDGHKLFDASWQTMAIDVRPVRPSDESEHIVEMEQTVDMVLDIARSKRPRGQWIRRDTIVYLIDQIDNPIPRPIPHEELVCDTSKLYSSQDACYPLGVGEDQSWSLSEIFGRPVKGTCLPPELNSPDSRPICINVPHERDVYISQGSIEHKLPSGHSRCFNLPISDNFEMVLPQQNLNIHTPRLQPPLYADRSFTGHGQERGGVRVIFTNPSATSPVEFIYLESLPWFMKPYLHTLKTQTSGEPRQSSDSSVIKDMYYRPAVDRRRGTQLEIHLSIPAASVLTLTYDFEKAILRYTEYPPDANRGFDVAPAVIRLITPTISPNTSIVEKGPVYLRTTSLLLSLPTPDFSMPYNVIILTSTVMALAFGSVYNLLVRRFVGADEVERYDAGRMKAVIRARLKLLREKVVFKVKGKGLGGGVQGHDEKKMQ